MAAKIFCDLCEKETKKAQRFVFRNYRDICPECMEAMDFATELVRLAPGFRGVLEDYLKQVRGFMKLPPIGG